MADWSKHNVGSPGNPVEEVHAGRVGTAGDPVEALHARAGAVDRLNGTLYASSVPEIQAAIDRQAGEGGGTVVVEPGTYPVDDETYPTLRSNVGLVARQPGSVTLRKAPGHYGRNFPTLRIEGEGGATARNWVVEGLVIDGNRDSVTFDAGVNVLAAGIGGRDLADGTIRNCRIEDTHGAGINLSGADRCTIDGVHARGAGHPDNDAAGVRLVAPRGCYLNAVTEACKKGFILGPTDNFPDRGLRDNVFRCRVLSTTNRHGVHLSTDVRRGQANRDTTLVAVVRDAQGHGLAVSGANADDNALDVRAVVRDAGRSGSGNGVTLVGVDRSTVTGVVSGAADHGIAFRGGSGNTVLAGLFDNGGVGVNEVAATDADDNVVYGQAAGNAMGAHAMAGPDSSLRLKDEWVLQNGMALSWFDSGGRPRELVSLTPDDDLELANRAGGDLRLSGGEEGAVAIRDAAGRDVFTYASGSPALSVRNAGLRAVTPGNGIGVTNAEDLSGKTGTFDGEIRMDDGTNTSKRMVPCVWDDENGRWVNTEDGSTFR